MFLSLCVWEDLEKKMYNNKKKGHEDTSGKDTKNLKKKKKPSARVCVSVILNPLGGAGKIIKIIALTKSKWKK